MNDREKVSLLEVCRKMGVGLGEAMFPIRQLEPIPGNKSFQDHAFKITFSGKLLCRKTHKEAYHAVPLSPGAIRACCLYCVLDDTQCRPKLPHPRASPFAVNVAYGLSFPSSHGLTLPPTPKASKESQGMRRLTPSWPTMGFWQVRPCM